MPLITCPQCGARIKRRGGICPKCSHLKKTQNGSIRSWKGFQYRSEFEVMGWPLVHIAIGRDKNTGKLLVAKGIIAIGQFGIGVITIAQFGIGLVFGFGQFVAGFVAVGQLALGVYFGLGQLATGITAIGQIAFGKYVLAQSGFGKHVWSTGNRDPEAAEYFTDLWQYVKDLVNR